MSVPVKKTTMSAVAEAFDDVVKKRSAYLDAAIRLLNHHPQLMDIVADAKKEERRLRIQYDDR